MKSAFSVSYIKSITHTSWRETEAWHCVAGSESLKRGPGEGSASFVVNAPRYLRWQDCGRTMAGAEWNLPEPIRQVVCAADVGARVV